MKIIGQRIRETRSVQKISQSKLAAIIGCTQQTISKLERKQSGTSTESLLGVARALNVSSDYLLGLSDDPVRVSDHQAVGTVVSLNAEAAPAARVSSAPVEDVSPVRDRRLAELLSAVVRHWEALESRYARDTWIADVYRWCPVLSVKCASLSETIAWLGWRVVKGRAAARARRG